MHQLMVFHKISKMNSHNSRQNSIRNMDQLKILTDFKSSNKTLLKSKNSTNGRERK
jgi:hypothetical protein